VDQLPNLGREQEMLDIMGVSSMKDLFEDIPVEIRSEGTLPLPPPQTEEEILRDAERLLGANVNLDSRPSFISAGLARNFVPCSVNGPNDCHKRRISHLIHPISARGQSRDASGYVGVPDNDF